MDTRPMNRSVRAPGKLAENKPSLPEKSKPTGGTPERDKYRPNCKQELRIPLDIPGISAFVAV